jgi:hypothetical protein
MIDKVTAVFEKGIRESRKGSGMTLSAVSLMLDEAFVRDNVENISKGLSTKNIENEHKVKEVKDINYGRNSHQRQFRKDTYRNF